MNRSPRNPVNRANLADSVDPADPADPAAIAAAMVSPTDVVNFWFGQPAAAKPRAEWFRKDPAFDLSITRQFGATINAAIAVETGAATHGANRPERMAGLLHWGAEPEAVLARIVVLDQFTRNVFRDTPRAFAGDATALAAARALVATGGHLHLSPLQRWFAYLPFEHAEDAAAQDESMQLFDALTAQHPALADARLYALKHQVIVQQFGRFPHRNLVLGRLSTEEEVAFLREPGSSF